MTSRAFAFTMPAFGHQGMILPRRNGDLPDANRLAAEVGLVVRGWSDASLTGYEQGQSNAKGASLG